MPRTAVQITAVLLALLHGLSAASTTLADTVPAGEGYPSRSITYQIPFEPGGQSDLEARRQKPLLQKLLGVDIRLIYTPGSGGALAWGNLVQQPPDGYFISGINIPHIVLQPLARRNAGYSTSDIDPIALFQATPIGLAVPADSPYQSLEEFLGAARAQPGVLLVAGSGTWSGHHMAHLLLQRLANISLAYVPHKGAASSVDSFLEGHVHAMWANSNDLVQHEDKLRVLAFATKEPFFAMPGAPTFASKGYPLYASIDRGAGAPPGTSPEVVAALEHAFLKISCDQGIREQMRADGFVPLTMGSSATRAYIEEMQERWAPVVRALMH